MIKSNLRQSIINLISFFIIDPTDDATHVVSVAPIRPDDGINETDNESSDYVLNMIDRPVVKGEADESQIVIINSLPSNDLNEKETAVIASKSFNRKINNKILKNKLSINLSQP